MTLSRENIFSNEDLIKFLKQSIHSILGGNIKCFIDI